MRVRKLYPVPKPFPPAPDLKYPPDVPAFEFSYRGVGESRMILDPLRRKYVKLTPEEWVRQNFVQYLIRDRGCPRGLIAIEKGFLYLGAPCRADVLVADRRGRPLMVTECKAPEIRLTQRTFDQLAHYNRVLKAPFLTVSNGAQHFCCRIDHEALTTTFLDVIPSYEEMLEWSQPE